jgi:hypothetical protein
VPAYQTDIEPLEHRRDRYDECEIASLLTLHAADQQADCNPITVDDGRYQRTGVAIVREGAC